MQFIDLKHQYQIYKAEIDGRMADVLEHGHYIMGLEVADAGRRPSSVRRYRSSDIGSVAYRDIP